MPTLSVVKYDFGKFFKWGGIALGALIILFIVLKMLFFVKELILPSPPPPPTMAFGKLPKTYFPDGVKKDFNYSIDTLTGKLPALPPSAKAYQMEQKGPDLLAVQHASDKVTLLGFNPHPDQISDFVYKWNNPDMPQQNLILNIKLEEFNLSSSFLNYESELKTENFKSRDDAIKDAQLFLQTLNLYPNDIDDKKTKVEFSSLDNGVITPSNRVVTSNLATVYYFQKSKDDVPIVYPQGINSSMRLVVGAGKLKGAVVDGKFSHQNIQDVFATYPIKTAEEAYDELKNGKGYIASYTGQDSNITIKNVYLGLYYEGKIQKYLTPVVVFEGNDNFVAYVPAITDEWIDK